MAVPSEYQEQCALASWLDSIGVLWCHVPNEDQGLGELPRNERMRRLAQAKAAGVKPGVPDVLVFTPPPRMSSFKGAVVEVKRRDGGKTSDAQFVWMMNLTATGWICKVCYGAREAVDWLKSLGYGMEEK